MNKPNPHPYLHPIPVKPRIERPLPAGLELINMSFNELPFGSTPAVEKALTGAIDTVQRYGNPSCDALRAALSATLDNTAITAANIIVGNGSEELLDMIGRVFARPGDEILISEYGYIQFPIVANRVGATLVKAPERNLTTDVDALLLAVTDNTRLVFLANPNNPTSTLLPLEEIERLVHQLPSHCVLVLDLAYGDFVGQEYLAHVHAFAAAQHNVIVTRTFSKAFGLAGVRVGWCQAPTWMLPYLNAARAMGPVNAFAQAAALAALQDFDTVLERVDTINRERERVAEALTQMGMQQSRARANFLLVALPAHLPKAASSADHYADYLFDTAGLLVNRTREAGLESYIRFSLSLPAHNDRLIHTTHKFLQTLQPGPACAANPERP